MHTLSNDLISFFANHPKLGTLTAILFTAYGTFTPIICDIHVPPIIMELIQIMAWVLGGIASCYTILGWQKKHKKNGKNF